MDESEISSDNRGGEKGKSIKYTPETKQQIISKYIRPQKQGLVTRIEGNLEDAPHPGSIEITWRYA